MTSPSMILTQTTQANLDNLRTALGSSNAILIQGEVGSGKSASVFYLAEQFGTKDNMLQVNVDDSFDSKDLLGKFSATEVPGAFEWVPGPLTLAVQNGYWLLMEDIDLASFDVFSVLQSLLENSTLFISDKNKIIKAHPEFKLIATQQLYSSGSTLMSRKSNSVPYAELWGSVILTNLPPEEQCEVVHALYPNVPTSTTNDLAVVSLKDRGVPLLNLRTLLKWASRVNARLASLSNNATARAGGNGQSQQAFLSSTVRETMLREAYDCVVAKYAPGAERMEALALIATACGVPENVALPMVQDAKPMEKLQPNNYTVGRITLPLMSLRSGLTRDSRIAFAPTAHAMSLLERLAAAVESRENVLLTGETGVGKTFIVQYLADQLGQNLVVHNLNQQTDTSDFMGGWKPLDVGTAVRDLYTKFTDLFSQCFNAEKNVSFLNTLQQAVSSRNWDRSLRQILKGCETFKLKNGKSPFGEDMQREWQEMEAKCGEVFETVTNARTNFAFTYEEGSLVKAWREGHWILLDELNLASTDVLERVSSVLGDVEKLFLTDKGEAEAVTKHPNFHVFANMNPPTDVGKKDLPPSLRSRFTEFYVSEPFNENDIRIVVREYVGFLTPDAKIDQITQFFLDCVANAKSKLCALDGESKPPSFSLRTLTRALSYVRKATPLYGYTVSLFDGLLLGFATPLQRQFHAVVEDLIVKNVFAGRRPQKPTLPHAPISGNHIAYEHMWIQAGDQEPFVDPSFILTDSVKGHLTNLARAVFANRPVLLEGPTSSGKSSMVKYLAELTGNKFVRINNHDSTEVQEYLGSYVTDEFGKLRFVDGILVNAVRHGYWVVLDELNLAPTDVLEALNRLLDDNCELFIPDTQETIKPHPHLRIFATQNPAGIYGGRKMLSRAFRNRFLEITVDEIPTSEVSTILRQRYELPESFAEKMVEVMTALQIRRQNSQIFAGRHGFITPRDLFRWAERKPRSYQELAEHGFLLLGERCRKPAERQVVKDVLETATKTELDEAALYSPEHWPFVSQYYQTVNGGLIDEYKIVWTASMQRLFTIVGICLEHQEPVLLVGETGSSKTTVCQLWAALLQIPLRIVNCHQHTEAADFLGSLRPVPPDHRDQALFEWRNGPLVQSMIDGDFFVLDEVSLAEDSVLERLNSVLEPSRSITLAEKSSGDLIVAHEQFRVMATMNPGGDFGKKELSPALRNRFTEIYVRPTTAHEEVTMIVSKRLEPELQEWAAKMADILCGVAEITSNSGAPQHISIRDVISWVSFMNAANNRCPAPVAFLQGLDAVILDGIGVGTGQSEASAEAVKRICVTKAQSSCPTSSGSKSDEEEPNAEDVAGKPFWTFFEGMEEPKLPPEMENRFFFGAPATRRNLSKLMRASIVKKAVLLEGSPGVGKTSIVEALGCALAKRVVRINLSEQTDIMDLFGSYLPCPADAPPSAADAESDEGKGPEEATNSVLPNGLASTPVVDANHDEKANPSPTNGGSNNEEQEEEEEEAAEGDAAPATEDTEPAAASSKGPQFAWSDGVLLRALKEGSWVILDELNLASQSVLEGLNALLDHRSTVFIPELNKEFHAHESFRVFACQNPVVEGGGRKGLPRSFLNRFMRVRVEAFETDDLICIAKAVCGDIDEDILTRMVNFVGELQTEVMVRRSFGNRGSPWEFNLRDVLRWAKAMKVYMEHGNPSFFAETFFLQRMRTEEDRRRCRDILARHFDNAPLDIEDARNHDFLLSEDGRDICFQRRRIATREESAEGQGAAAQARSPSAPSTVMLLPSQASAVKSLLMCVTLNQFALLIGPSGGGKTFALNTAANLAGAKLVTFSMNASCDTVDLLGGFDQVEGKQGEFEWRDSLIVEAMLYGHWLVLDNVNYCNASVLDRLNPLVEPNGVLSINEQGLVNNEVRVIRPHPRFRLFATLNPKYGEISRAMRNRAVELFLAPVPIPSPEAALLSGAKNFSPDAGTTTDGAGVTTEASVERLAEFHRRFVAEAFGGADTTNPSSAALSDALASGAPNLFTLLRASRMLAPPGSATLSQEALAKAIQHCYLDNRSGHWRHKMALLRDALADLLASPHVPLTDRAAIADLLEATVLSCYHREVDGGEEEEEAAAGARESGLPSSSGAFPFSSTAEADDRLLHDLARKRVLRAALPLARRRRHLNNTAENGEEGEVETLPHFTDLLLHFVLEQIFDSVPSPLVAAERLQYVAEHHPELPADQVESLVHARFANPGALEELYSRACLVVGPHADDLQSVHAINPQLSDSALVNSALATLLQEISAALSSIVSPLLLQRVSGPLSVFLRLLRDPVTLDNYIVLTTHALLLLSMARESTCNAEETGGHILTSTLAEALIHFLDALRRYLNLPFSLTGSGKSALHGSVPQPRITTAEEREALQQWRYVAAAAASAQEANHALGTVSDRLLSLLWQAAAFRTEFTATQQLLSTLSTATSATRGAPVPAHALLALRNSAKRLLDLHASKQSSMILPLSQVANDVEMALWRQATTAQPDTAVDILGQCSPLLLSRFISRFGLDGARHLFSGSWAEPAVRCLQYASKVSVLAIGNRNANDHARVLEGLGSFLNQCPVASPLPLRAWEANARDELYRILQGCFPGVLPELVAPTAGVAHGGADLSTVTEAKLRSAVVALSAKSAASDGSALSTTVEAQVQLLLRIVALSASTPARLSHGGSPLAISSRPREEDATNAAAITEDDGRHHQSFALVVLLWVLKCRLLLPQSPIDPMYEKETQIAIADKECQLLERLQAAFEWADGVMLRTSVTSPRELIASLHERVVEDSARARETYVVRPDTSGKQYASLVNQLYQLCANHFSDERLLSLFVTPPAESAKALRERMLACDNWSALVFEHVTEMLHHFGGYEDVTLNFAEAALLAAMAAKACCLANNYGYGDDSEHEGASTTLFSHQQTMSLMQFPLAEGATALPVPSSALTQAVKRKAGHGPQLRHVLTYLDSCLETLRGCVAQSADRDFVEGVFASYRELYHTVEVLEAKERREEEMAVLYKEKALVIEGDDEKLLKKLKSLFPSYDGEFVVDDAPGVGGDGEEMNDAKEEKAVADADTSRSAKYARIMLKESDGAYVRRLVEAHGNFYRRLVSGGLDNSCVNGKVLVEAFKARFDTLSAELHRFHRHAHGSGSSLSASTAPVLSTLDAESENREHLLLNGFSARAALLRQQQEVRSGVAAAITATTTAPSAPPTADKKPVAGKNIVTLQDRKESAFNIYYDPDPSELSRFSKPLQQLLAAVQSLAERYPDTVSLQRCLRIGHKVAALPALTTPLMKVLTGCEILLRECYEWERNASHTVSLMSHMTELSSFVLRWRRLELHCWQHVFKAKRDEFELKASLAWFSFYDLVRGDEKTGEEKEDDDSASEEDEADALTTRCRKMFQRLSQFLWDSCYGDFLVRLQLVRNLACELLASFGPYSPLATTALHVADFFTQFEELVRGKASEAIRPVEEDVMEFAKIMRWEDANYYAVRATSEKAHLKMARALGELEDVLRTPILPVISAEEQRCEDDPAMGFTAPPPVALTKADKRKKERKSKKEAESKKAAAAAGSGGKRDRNGKKQDAGKKGKTKDDSSASDEDDGEDETSPAASLRWQVRAVSGAYDFFDASAKEIITRVAALQAPKTPNQVKVRALKTFFDTVADFGVRHTHENQSQPWEVLFASTEALLASRVTEEGAASTNPTDRNGPSSVGQRRPARRGKRDASATDLAASASLETVAQQHYRFARWLQRLREAERKPHQDLSAAQVKRATGIAETLFSHAVDATELLCTLHTMRRELSALAVYASDCGSDGLDAAHVEEGCGGGDAASLLDESLRLCCVVQSFYASLQWMEQKGLLRAGPGAEGGAQADATRSAIMQVGVKCHDLWQLCVRYEPLRRAAAPQLPVTAAANVLRELHELQAACERLATSEDRRVSAAARVSADKIASFFTSRQAALAEAVRDGATAKRARTEAEEAVTETTTSMSAWQQRAAAALAELVANLSGDDDVIVPSSPLNATTTSAQKAVPDANGDKDSDSDGDEDGTSERTYLGYHDKIASLKSRMRLAYASLQSLLRHTPDAKESTTLSVAERNALHRHMTLAMASLADVEQTLLATTTAHSNFGVVIARLFTVLVKKGFCKTEGDDEEDNNEDGEGEGGLKSGTGMDDGEGEKDVTNEIENEDQLMNMKDKEEQEDEDEGGEKDKKDEGDGDEEEEDNAADVETDFQAKKEKREESEQDDDDNSGEGEDESDQEMGSVDGEEEQDRKKMRKDKNDANDMNEDDGDEAEEVPEDEYGNEQEEKPDDEEGEETGGFDNKENEIREAEKEREGEHELAGMDEKSLASDDQGDQSGDEDDDSGYTSKSDESVSQKGADTEEDEDGEEDDGLDKNKEDEKGSEGGDEDREDDSASTDSERSAFGEDQDERALSDDENGSEDGSDDVEQAADGKDENVFEGGFQDEETGQEATERKEDPDAEKRPKQPNQPDTIGNEEEQAGDEQEQDEAGRNWKKQQEQNQAAQQRKDNTDERTRSQQHNPYRAIKEALKRHEREVQQLNLNQRVEVKKDDKSEKEPDSKIKDDEASDDDVDKEPKKDVTEFDFDEHGDQEGMAATDERNKEDNKFAPPTEAEQEADKDSEKGDDEGANNEEAPKDRRRKREKETEDLTEIKEEDDDDDGGDDKHSKNKKRDKNAKVTARSAVKEEEVSSSEDSDVDGSQDENEDHAMSSADAKLERGRKLWQEQETAVQGLSQQLCEQLRLILAPTLADKLQGDYKTGKRLNMKRIIPYIASQFKKDRIWLRRTKPNKRTYQIMVALDDSLSMQCNEAGVLSCRAVALIAKALQQLEVGEIGISCFGKETKIVHGLEEPFIADSGPRAFSEITFQQTSTNMKLFLETTLDYLDAARERSGGQTRSTTQQLQQVMFVISDGQITEDRAELRKLLVRAEENHQMIVFVLLDIKATGGGTETGSASRAAGAPSSSLSAKDLKGLSAAERMRRLKAERESRLKRVQSNSILDMQIVEFKQGKVVRRSYMEDFPFPYYLIVHDLQNLPEVIADAMRQWFELLNAGQ